MSALSPNATSPQSLTTAAPMVAGTFWLGACVDSVSGESNMGNNCSTGAQIAVLDTDSDGVADGDDNCPVVANPSQIDTDGDGPGNACDAFPLDASESVDIDGDGMGDVFENRFGLNLNDPNDAGLDNDRDGLTNLEEFQVGRNPTVNETAVLQIINTILVD